MFKQIDIPTLMEEARQRRNRRLILIFVLGWLVLFLAVVLGAGVHAQEATTPAPTLHAAAQLDYPETKDACTVFRVTVELAASAGHCVEPSNPDKYTITLADGRVVTARVAAYADEMSGLDDWALFKRTGIDPWPTEWATAKLDCTGLVRSIGAEVRGEGYPHISENFLVVWGRVNGVSKPVPPWAQPLIYHTLPIAGGDSGGPLYDDKTNEVFGILVGVNSSNQSLSTSQPIKPICDALHLS